MRSKIPFAVLVLTMSTTLLAAGVARADDEDPAKGKFTLEQATKGLAGSVRIVKSCGSGRSSISFQVSGAEAPAKALARAL